MLRSAVLCYALTSNTALCCAVLCPDQHSTEYTTILYYDHTPDQRQVLEDNVADVCEIDLSDLAPAAWPPAIAEREALGARHSEMGPVEREALASSMHLPLRFYLYRGGLPTGQYA